MTVWYLTRLAWYALAFMALHVYLGTWFGLERTMAGVTVVAALLPMTYTNSWGHPDHIPELALFTFGCAAIARRNDFLFALSLVLATLNRETAVFLVVAYAVAYGPLRSRVSRTLGFGALWMTVFVGLRWWRGFVPYDMWQLDRNIGFLGLLPAAYDPYYRAYAWFGVVTFGPLLWLVWGGRRTLPEMPRRILLVVPLVAGVGFAVSSIIETRILTPLFPLMLPALMHTFARADTKHGPVR